MKFASMPQILLFAGSLFLPTTARADLDPARMPKIGFGVKPLFRTQFIAGELGYRESRSIDLGTKLMYEIVIDIPMYRYLTTGVSMTLLPGILGNEFEDFFDIGSFVLDLSLLVRPQFPFRIGTQNFACYLQFPLGATIDFFGHFGTTYLGAARIRPAGGSYGVPSRFLIGLGVHGAGMAGIEYFPWDFIGIFAEGGVDYRILWHQFKEPAWNFWNYQLWGFPFMGGIKIVS